LEKLIKFCTVEYPITRTNNDKRKCFLNLYIQKKIKTKFNVIKMGVNKPITERKENILGGMKGINKENKKINATNVFTKNIIFSKRERYFIFYLFV
tara:strand:- start:1552 stop:1839 length:288 start_codon:yes stop_codon:yes gene_type:complete